jgi:hypothetical protein
MKKQRVVFCIGAFLILLLLISQCTFKDPEAPSWDVNFVIPLINETYTMEELIEDEEDLFVDPNETIFFRVEQEFDRMEINDFMIIDDVDTAAHIPIIPLLQDTVWKEITLNESMIVDTVILRSGVLDLVVTNRTDKDIDLALVLPFLYLAGDPSPYMIHASMSPEQTIHESDIDLSGALLHPKIENGKNVVRYGVFAVFQGVQASFYDDVRVELRIKDMVMERFVGGLDELTVNLETQRDTLDLPEELEGMKFGPIDATLQAYSSFESLPGTVDFIIKGIREDGGEAYAAVEQENIRTGENPISLENVSDIINLYPDYIEFDGTIRIGQGYDEGNPVIMNYDDYLLNTAEINVPMIFEFPADWINETDVDTLDLNNEDDEEEKSDDGDEDDGGPQTNEIIRDNVNSAGIVAVAENHFPFGAKVTLIFSKMRGDSTLYTMSHPTDVVKALDLKPGVTGGGDGTGENPNVVLAPLVNTFDLVLNEEEIRLFESPEVYMGVRLQFYPTNKLVKTLPTDYLTLKARVEASLNTKIPEDEDEEEEGGAQ